MTAPDLHGLNVIDTPVLGPSQLTDLANTPAFPDLEAQLELWTTLAFQSDEPFVPRPLSPTSSTFDKNIDLALAQHQPIPSDFDMTRFFTNFGIDPFAVPPPPSLELPSQQDITHINLAVPQTPRRSADRSSFTSSHLPSEPSDAHNAPPPAKRSRTRKTSLSTAVSDNSTLTEHGTPHPSSSVTGDTERLDSEEPASPYSPNTTTPITATEDKRRRNTAASARFRAKKKEREAALEKKSKELEGRVGELERECEALRRENGWLKGLVVGVTNAGNSAQGTKRRRGEDGQTMDNELKESIKA